MAGSNFNNQLQAANSLTTVSYNMHGFNQGFSTVRDLIFSISPDVIMLQEHWLTPANLCKFDKLFPTYFSFGSSAMVSCIEQGPLMGRPYGGVMILLKNELRAFIRTVHASDRCVIVKLFNMIFINVYMPCAGTTDRKIISEELLTDINVQLEAFSDCTYLFGGDFNTDLDSTDPVCQLLNSFMDNLNMRRCDTLFNCNKAFTYVNDALGNYSCLDYILTTDLKNMLNYYVIDSGSNLSDHVPVVAVCRPNLAGVSIPSDKPDEKNKIKTVKHLRWDHADLATYYYLTGVHLQELLDDMKAFEQINSDQTNDDINVAMYIDIVYRKTVEILRYCANATVPFHKTSYYKFWWNQELDQLKDQSISSHNAWKAAGRPSSGPISNKSRTDKMTYKLRIRHYQQQEHSEYSNELHDALLDKQGSAFWKCWKAKFETNNQRIGQVDGSVDDKEIVNKFMLHFSAACSSLTVDGSNKLKQQYDSMRPDYNGIPHSDEYEFDAELTGRVINDMKRGKAACFDGLTAEHLQHCHPALPTLLAKVFNLMMDAGHVPEDFGYSYTIPLPKGNCSTISKSLSVEDFRGISISPVISKAFEHCALNKYNDFFRTSDHQFGFKKGSGCTEAIYTVRRVVDYYTKADSTVNLCALDLKKAFDKMNHHGLFIKLMKRNVPNKLLQVLENWFSICKTCVRWGSEFSMFFVLKCGIRQGGVLSPYLFAVFIDDIVESIRRSTIGCHINLVCTSIFLYADDIILLAPSIDALQSMILLCEHELTTLDMALNVKKSVCWRIGPRFNVECVNVHTLNGNILAWVESCRYLGITILASRQFKCSFSSAKKSLYRSFNAIYGKIGSSASELVVLQLLQNKCLPALLYGLEACPLNVSDVRSFDFAVTRLLMKLFKTSSNLIIDECKAAFGIHPISKLICSRKMIFLNRYLRKDNFLTMLFYDEAIADMNCVAADGGWSV